MLNSATQVRPPAAQNVLGDQAPDESPRRGVVTSSASTRRLVATGGAELSKTSTTHLTVNATAETVGNADRSGQVGRLALSARPSRTMRRRAPKAA
jgi:hypothetical protein